jgi:hypothetical protein
MAGYHTQGEFDRDMAATQRMLKETYVGAIIQFQEKHKENGESEETKNIQIFLQDLEKMIIYFDQSETWLKEFHEEAQKGAPVNDEPEDEFERLAKAGNFESTKK